MSFLEQSGGSYEDLYVGGERRELDGSGEREESFEERLLAYPGNSGLTSDSRSSQVLPSTDPTETLLKQEEFLRLQHERTIEDLHNRMAHLEQELQGASRKGNKDGAGKEMRERLEVAVKQREEAKRECEELRERVAEVREKGREEGSGSSRDLMKRLEETRKANAALAQELKALQASNYTTEDRLSSFEDRISALDHAYELQLQVTATLQSRLKGSTRPKEVLQTVTRQIAENEAKVRELEERLTEAESHYLLLSRVVSNRGTPKQYRRVSSGSFKEYSGEQSYLRPIDRQLGKRKKKAKEDKEEVERPKRRPHSEKPRDSSRKKANIHS